MSKKVRIENSRIYEYESTTAFWTGETHWQKVVDGDELTFPTPEGRAYYREGDFIFPETFSVSTAGLEYSEFRHRLNDEFTLGSFLMGLLELNSMQRVIRIESISGEGRSARIGLKHFMVIAPGELLEIHPRRSANNNWSSNRLSQNIAHAAHSRAGLIWIPIGRAVMTIATLPFGGAARGMASAFLRPVFRHAGRRSLAYLLRCGGSRAVRLVASKAVQKTSIFIAKVARDTATGVTRRYFSHLHSNQLRGMVNPNSVRALNLDSIIQRALRDSLAENISGEVIGTITSVIPGVSPDDIMNDRTRANIERYLGDRVMEFMLTPLKELVRASITSIPVGAESDFQLRFANELEQRMSGRFSSSFGSMVGTITEDFMSRPELVM